MEVKKKLLKYLKSLNEITIIIPAFNEEDVLKAFYRETCTVIDGDLSRRYNFIFLFVNDGSNDKTLSILTKLSRKDERVNFIDLSRNYGKEVALTAGIDYVSENTNAVILMDADLQHPPSLIPKLLESWEAGIQDVYARRKNDQ